MPLPRPIVAALLAPALLSLVACRHSAFPDVPAGFHEFAYIANSGSNTLSVLDLVYLRPDRTLRVGDAPVALAANPVRSEIYAVNRGSNSVSVVDAVHNDVVASIPVRRAPVDLALAPDGRIAFVANSAANSISVVDLQSRSERTFITTPAAPTHLALAADNRSLVVTSAAAGAVFIFAVQPSSPDHGAAPLTLRARFDGCPGASAVRIIPDSSRAFIACSAGHQVLALSLAADPHTWPGRQNSSLLADHLLALLDVGQQPSHLALKPDGGEIFVSNTASDSVSEIATFSAEVGGTYTIASQPGHALVSSDNSSLWISNTGADSLGLYSIDDGRLTGSIRTGSGPDALAFSADEHLLLAADVRSGDVAVILTTAKSGPTLFTLLPAGKDPTAILTHAFTARR